MGRPFVCCFSQLPIEHGEEVLYMVARHRENMRNHPAFPFAAFYPVTPFVTATYDEDSGLYHDDDQALLLTEYMDRVGYPMPKADHDHEPGNFSFVIKKNVYEFWGSLTYMSFTDGIEQKSLGSLNQYQAEMIDHDIMLALRNLPQRPATFFYDSLQLAEGESCLAVEGIRKALDAIPRAEVTEDNLRAIAASFSDIIFMWRAMLHLRRVMVPHGYVGTQTPMPENFSRFGKFLVETSEAALLDQEY